MKAEWSRLHYILLTVVIIAGIGVFLLAKIIFLSPANQDLERLTSSLENEKKILKTLRSQEENQTTISLQSSREMQRKLPVLPVQDQVLISLDKAESLSNSFIQSIIMEQNPEVVEDNDLSNPLPEGQPEQSEEQTKALSGVKSLTFNLEVVSPEFSDLLSFLQELNRLSRIISIDAITFEDQDDGERLSHLVTFSAYYYPELTSLQDELPQYNYEPPSNKDNPLDRNASTSIDQNQEHETEGEDNDTTAEPPPEHNDNEELYIPETYVVQSNDTLFRIIKKFYGTYNRALAERVKQVNGMASDQVNTGSEIKLPVIQGIDPSKTNVSVEGSDQPNMHRHVVQEDETLFRIIKGFYGTYSKDLADRVKSLNGLSSETVYAGEAVLLPEY